MSSKTSHLALIGQAGTIILLVLLLGSQIIGGRIHSSTPFESVESKLTESLDSALYAPVSNSSLRRYLDLDSGQFDSVAFFRSPDAMSANELAVVQFSSPAAADAFEQAASKRISSQHDIYAGYAPEQAALMDSALISVQDNYALYYVGDQPGQMESLFVQALKEGK